ncbi:amidohydrolase family protein [Pseudonocardia humida]|uniref:Amidohydrolase family protein n=1 Tax=Pseudonocardia humida TaxID=2800819 RepID=A0ABT1A6S7_9PSEU|nr:amidohydrolase family protein [Pseudonocardia humida]MCO1658529.1 amidohydrolase family protein [Pseudonocardia humida]
MASTIIRNVRVFNGKGLSEPTAVAFADGRLVDADRAEGVEVQGGGGTVLPGLIDAHVHVDDREQLSEYGRWGVTTVLDMGARDWSAMRALRDAPGVATVRSAGSPACAVRGTAVRKMGYPGSAAVAGPADAARFVADRVAQGVDHVKIVLEEKLPFRPKPLDAATVGAVVAEAHGAGLLVAVHATSPTSFRIASDAGADVVTHAPLAGRLDDGLAREMARRGAVVCPTLIMMKTLVEHFPFPVKPRSISYANVVDAVRTLRRAGVALLAGTDANSDPTAPNTIPHGVSLHDELELLVQVGLTPVEALLSATSSTADAFGLSDRGRIRAGSRADVVLVDGDPTTDITTTRNVRGVWIGGVRIH